MRFNVVLEWAHRWLVPQSSPTHPITDALLDATYSRFGEIAAVITTRLFPAPLTHTPDTRRLSSSTSRRVIGVAVLPHTRYATAGSLLMYRLIDELIAYSPPPEVWAISSSIWSSN